MTPQTVARQGPLSVEFPRQEQWSGLPFPLPGDFPNTGIEPTSALQADSLLLSHQGSPPDYGPLLNPGFNKPRDQTLEPLRCAEYNRAGYAERSKSEREKQILHINAYVWDLENWY